MKRRWALWPSSCTRGTCAFSVCRRPAPTAFAARTGRIWSPRCKASIRGLENPNRQCFSLCRELGIGFVPFSPLGRGFLTGTVTDADRFATNDVRRRLPRFQTENPEKNRALVNQLENLRAVEGLFATATRASVAAGERTGRRTDSGDKAAAPRRRKHRRRGHRPDAGRRRGAGRGVSDRHRGRGALPARRHAPARDRAGALTLDAGCWLPAWGGPERTAPPFRDSPSNHRPS
jgi:aldo/keto reductase family protein